MIAMTEAEKMNWAAREHDLTVNDEQAYAQHLLQMEFDPGYAERMAVRRAYVTSVAWAAVILRRTEAVASFFISGPWSASLCGGRCAMRWHTPPIYGRREVQAMFGRDDD
jgi:hypothetical protein